MKEYPIIFSTPMVKAIIEGKKSQTRRVIIPQPKTEGGIIMDGIFYRYFPGSIELDVNNPIKSPYGIGDILWVRETFQMYPTSVILNGKAGNSPYKKIPKEKPDSYYIEYRATSDKALCGKWRSSRYIPKYAARIFLKVTSVMVERLQDIAEKDAEAEGIEIPRCEMPDSYTDDSAKEHCTFYVCSACDHQTLKGGYSKLWDTLNSKRGYPWESNPWVWVYKFMRIEK